MTDVVFGVDVAKVQIDVAGSNGHPRLTNWDLDRFAGGVACSGGWAGLGGGAGRRQARARPPDSVQADALIGVAPMVQEATGSDPDSGGAAVAEKACAPRL